MMLTVLLIVALVCWILEEIGKLSARFSILLVILALLLPLVGVQ
jgi:hypothetical protein